MNMQELVLDGKELRKKEDMHSYLKRQLEVPEYHGANLDALWDVLSTYDQPLKIELMHEKTLHENLGNYGKALVQLLEDAAEANPNIHFQVGRSGTDPL